MNSDLLQGLLEVDFKDIPIFVINALRNPASNPTAFALILVLLTLLVAVVVLVLVAIFMSLSDEEELEYESGPSYPPGATPTGATAAAEFEERSRLPRYVTFAIWAAAFVLVWIAGGWVSRGDQMCVACHIDGSIHVLRMEEPDEDPHGKVACVACHETPNMVASVTTKVPGRAVHFVGGYFGDQYGAEYGVPVANLSCAECHGDALAVTRVDNERGIRVSHKEPLASQALCSDCHAPRPNTGVIDRYTVGMDPCLRCHDGDQASSECEYCHSKDIGLAVQASSVVEPRDHADIVECGGCHGQETCDACHGMRLPHSRAFMNGGHAREAVEDIWYNNGQTCNRCHTSNRRSCGNCHGSPFPSHPASYMPKGHQSADPYNNGCTQCHDYLAWMSGRNFCGNCHPRYNQAPPAQQ